MEVRELIKAAIITANIIPDKPGIVNLLQSIPTYVLLYVSPVGISLITSSAYAIFVHPEVDPQTALQTSGSAQATRSVYRTRAAIPGNTRR